MDKLRLLRPDPIYEPVIVRYLSVELPRVPSS